MPSARARAARIARPIRSRLSPTVCVAEHVDAGARKRLRDERSVRVERAVRAAAPCRPQRSQRWASSRSNHCGYSKRTSAAKPRAASIIASRRSSDSSAPGCAACVAFALPRQVFDEAHETRVHRLARALLEDLSDARREAGGRDRDAHRTGLGDRRHGDEAVARLIDAAKQEPVAIRQRSQASRELRVLRRRDDEERTGEVLVAQRPRVVDPRAPVRRTPRAPRTSRSPRDRRRRR